MKVLWLAALLMSLPSLALCDVRRDRQKIAKTDVHRIERILGDLSSWRNDIHSRPFVTLTFAQSVDGKIAVSTASSSSANLPLSGHLSTLLTHGLRSIHDGILVGGNTLAIDNPRLTNRLWGDEASDEFAQPRPVVLDTTLRHVRTLLTKLRVEKQLIVCCSEEAMAVMARDFPELGRDDKFKLLPCKVEHHGRLDVEHVLEQLYQECGIRSLMVEGGSSVITSFLLADAYDALCITIAPKLILSGGLAAISTSAASNTEDSCSWVDWSLPTESDSSSFIPLGDDCIFLAKKRPATLLSRNK